jgi:dTMP kinase
MNPKRRALYVVLEGIDGAGKSTLQRAVAAQLRRRRMPVKLWREPSDRPLGRLAQSAGARDPWTGTVLFTLDRYLARPELDRALSHPGIVLADRSYFSTRAYQGSALSRDALRRLARLERSATRQPDLILLLDLPPTEALRRIPRRGQRRMPLERRRTLTRTARAYRRLARGGRWTVLDATQPPRELTERALELILAESRRGRRSR